MIFKAGNRYRGIMPFRRLRESRKPITSKQRTGEPFPSTNFWNYPEGYGKRYGSYTDKMHQSLLEWMRKKEIAELTFDYKLSRHKTIKVVGTCPFIKHQPGIGFILLLKVSSIDGLLFKSILDITQFIWNRIVAREQFLTLPEGKKQLITNSQE